MGLKHILDQHQEWQLIEENNWKLLHQKETILQSGKEEFEKVLIRCTRIASK